MWGRPWPEFILTKGVKFFDVGLDHPLVQVQVKNGDYVYLLRDNSKYESDLVILQRIEYLETIMFMNHRSGFAGVQIPCVYADLEPDLDWILGMKNGESYIWYAQQKIQFGMNYQGFAVREETAMTMERGMVRMVQPYMLSPKGESFLFWRRRKGVGFPVSLFQFSREDYKDPGDLNKIVQ